MLSCHTLFLFCSIFMLSSIYSLKIIVDSFKPADFVEPHGWLRLLTRNHHYQTIIGSEALRHKILKLERPFQTTTERFTTECESDFFDVEYSEDFETNENVVLILHGLESSTKGPLVTRMATAFASKGFAFCLISFRGCSGVDNDNPGSYHFGFTTDISHLTEILYKKYPSKKIYYAGFSLGGNVILKYLGELGDKAHDLNIMGAVVTSVPFDPVASQPKLDSGLSRALYSENFLATLKKKAELKYERFPGTFDIQKVRRCKTIGDFDEAFICPVFGFLDRNDYYRKTGSKWWLNKIRVPIIAINALDDPFIEESALPTKNDIGDLAPVRIIYHKYGGHCGFMCHGPPPAPHGWLGEEMSRALSHINIEYHKYLTHNASYIFS